MLKNWVDSNKPYAYSGVNKIHHYLRGEKKLSDIRKDLAGIRTYTLHKEPKKITKFNPFFIYYKNQMWQADLVYLPNFINENEGAKYLMCVLEVFSRKLYVKIMKNKDKKTALETFDSIHRVIHESPEILYTDLGGEFNSREFKKYCVDNSIKQIFALNDTKAPHVERAQRSLQSIIYKIMEERQTRRFLSIISEAVNIYNNRVNRITGFSPNEASDENNKTKVLENLEKYYRRNTVLKNKPKYIPGDSVRMATKKTAFEKGYQPKFSEEVFKIYKVLTNLPQTRYRLSSFNGSEKIKGTFYERELTKAEHEEFKIEKVLETRKRGRLVEHFVKWVGYSDEHNQWIKASDLKKF